MNYLFGVLGVLIMLLITMGCTSQQVVPNVTEVPTTSGYIVAVTHTPEPTVIETPVTLDPTPATPDPTTLPVTTIQTEVTPTSEPTGPVTIISDDPVQNTSVNSFAANGTYTSDDFSVSAPDTWQISQAFGNATNQHSSGPDLVNPVNRIVIITDGIANFTAITSDLVIRGHYDPLLTIEDCRNTITPQFPDVSGREAIVRYDYLHTVLGTPYAQFDVVIPQVSEFYPLQYTERDLASYSHIYTFRFSTSGNMTAYKEVKDTMFSSLVTEERVKRAPS